MKALRQVAIVSVLGGMHGLTVVAEVRIFLVIVRMIAGKRRLGARITVLVIFSDILSRFNVVLNCTVICLNHTPSLTVARRALILSQI